jgi:hypothetical protein
MKVNRQSLPIWKIVNNETEAGLKFKIPLVDTVIRLPSENSFMGWRTPENTDEGKPILWVDTTVVGKSQPKSLL